MDNNSDPNRPLWESIGFLNYLLDQKFSDKNLESITADANLVASACPIYKDLDDFTTLISKKAAGSGSANRPRALAAAALNQLSVDLFDVPTMARDRVTAVINELIDRNR